MRDPYTPQRDEDSIDQYLGGYYDPRPYNGRYGQPAGQQPPPEEPEEKKQPLIVRFLRTLSFYIIVVLVCLFLNFYVVRLGLVNGNSMEPTLSEQDVVIIWQPFYTPAPGDIVVTDDDNVLGISLTKRVIATEGQHLRIEGGAVYVDGVLLEESYLGEAPSPSPTIDMEVPAGHIFVMGDNRNASFDSREMGALPASQVMGKVVLRIWPLNHITTLQFAPG